MSYATGRRLSALTIALAAGAAVPATAVADGPDREPTRPAPETKATKAVAKVAGRAIRNRDRADRLDWELSRADLRRLRRASRPRLAATFPIRGTHNLGYSFENQFGGGRGHKGLDAFAECGTKLVAAVGGTVKAAGMEGAMGNYVVIDADRTNADHVYLHLQETPLVKQGERVRTGQQIGGVGDTGSATGCHLHFELWPGGWNSGNAVDPAPMLKRWDARS